MNGLENINVKEILNYQGPRADTTFVLGHSSDVQRLRTFYLRNKRDEWEWVDSNSAEPNPYVQIKEKT